MRALLLVAAILAAPSPVVAQSLDGSLNGLLFGNLNSGLTGSLMSGLDGSIGTTQRSRSRAQLEQEGFGAIGACAPTQIDRNHTGCRPIREFGLDYQSSGYDTSIQAMRPLGSVTLDSLILAPAPGPAGPLE